MSVASGDGRRTPIYRFRFPFSVSRFGKSPALLRRRRAFRLTDSLKLIEPVLDRLVARTLAGAFSPRSALR
jgi:hypothetical protein